MVKILVNKSYSIKFQVLNYNAQVIGIIASRDQYEGFIPCYPSSPMIDLESKWIDDITGKSYLETLAFLENVYTISKNISD